MRIAKILDAPELFKRYIGQMAVILERNATKKEYLLQTEDGFKLRLPSKKIRVINFHSVTQENYTKTYVSGWKPGDKRNPATKLTTADVVQIRKLKELGWSYKKLAELKGVSQNAIIKIVKRITWKHVT